MSEPDEFDLKAAEMLPCHAGYDWICCHKEPHSIQCPAHYRPAVAAALRAQAQEIERLKYELSVIGDMAVVDFNDAVVGRVDKAVSMPKTYADARRAELEQVAQLRARMAALHGKIMALAMKEAPDSLWQTGYRKGVHAAAELIAGAGKVEGER